jgi:NADPH-dependent curcumin reductase CurA
MGARVIRIAGGADKCRYVVDYLGFDAAVKPSDDFSVIVIKPLSMRGFLVFDYKNTQQVVHALNGWIR